MCNNLCIGIGQKLPAFFKEGFFQRKIILNNAIMDNGYLPGYMRMCVLLRRLAMSSPSGMSNTNHPVQGLLIEAFLQDIYIPNPLPYSEATVIYYDYSGRVVTPVFKPLQGINQYGDSILPPYVTHDS